MFERFAIPTPFQVGPVNCYLADRTLIDPGPDSEDAWEALQEALADRGLTVADIERVLITHPHPDHFGLAGRLREDGAQIVASRESAAIIEGFADRLAFEQSYFVPFLTRHGLQDDVARTIVELPEAFLEFAPDVIVDRRLDDGEAVRVAESVVTAEAVRGHALGELVFTYGDAEGDHAIVGDHVLDPITPNPFLQAPLEPGGDRPRMLPAYN
ncbi:MAG: MBL fold metallo-hydrolase, partial [Halobacteriota archaeon]